MGNMDINEVIKGEAYDFLRQQERLGKQIDFLCFGGSVSYGLNTPESDIDIRGACSPLKWDIIGCGTFRNPNDIGNGHLVMDGNRFEQFNDRATDTCIYCTNKLLRLLCAANPNALEMLGCLPEHYAHISPVGKLILENKKLFITKKAFGTFAGYARQQLIRLQNSLARNATELEKMIQTVAVINRAYEHLEERFPTFRRDMLELYVVDGYNERIDSRLSDMFMNIKYADTEEIMKDLDESAAAGAKLKVNLRMEGISPEDMKGVVSECSNIIASFSSHTGHRNHKKDAAHEDKHASHLKRLILTCKEMFVTGDISTYCGDYIEELMDIKKGKYRLPNGSYDPKFFRMIDKEMEELKELKDKSSIPDEPDMAKVMMLQDSINLSALHR